MLYYIFRYLHDGILSLWICDEDMMAYKIVITCSDGCMSFKRFNGPTVESLVPLC